AVRFDDSLNDRSAAIGEHGRQVLIEAEPLDFVFGGELNDLRACRKRGRRRLHSLGGERTGGNRLRTAALFSLFPSVQNGLLLLIFRDELPHFLVELVGVVAALFQIVDPFLSSFSE